MLGSVDNKPSSLVNGVIYGTFNDLAGSIEYSLLQSLHSGYSFSFNFIQSGDNFLRNEIAIIQF
jgi:hypothetical protein